MQQLQPVAYQVLSNALRNQELVHAYLFHGPKGVDLSSYATWLAQSILCEQPTNGQACLHCNTCERVANGLYVDVVTLDGTTKTIGKEEIQQVIMQFNLTGLEQLGTKIYIINSVENATPEAMNSLLKFLEEPSNQHTYAILLTNQFQGVMPTIVSRCLNISFNSVSVNTMKHLLSTTITEELDQYLLANLCQDIDDAYQLYQSPLYQKTKQQLSNVMNMLLVNFHKAVTTFEVNGMNDKKQDKEFLKLYFELLEVFFRDLNRQPVMANNWYRELLNNYQPYQPNAVKGVNLCLQVQERLQRTPNLLLLVEYAFSQLKEIMR